MLAPSEVRRHPERALHLWSRLGIFGSAFQFLFNFLSTGGAPVPLLCIPLLSYQRIHIQKRNGGERNPVYYFKPAVEENALAFFANVHRLFLKIDLVLIRR